MINKPIYYLLFIALLFAYGCSNTKYLKEGEMLYTGGEVIVKDSLVSRKERKAIKQQLEGLLRPRPNKSFLGLRIKLYMYNIAGEPKKEKGFRYWLRNKVGEPPVLFSQVDRDYNADVLQNYVENQGYFQTRTSTDSVSKNRRAKAIYKVTTGKQYTIRKVIFPKDTMTSALDSTIATVKRRSLLKKGQPYSLDVIKQERERIDQRLKNKGYYYFNPDFLLVQVDSTVGNHEVDLIVKVKEETPERARKVYRINDIYVYPNYSLSNVKDTVRHSTDSIQKYKDFTIIDPEHTFRPIIFDRTLFFHKGDKYSRKDHNLSLNRLVSLGTFKFVKNEFRLSKTKENSLDAYYYFTPLERKSLRFEVLGKSNSANYNGSEVNVNWSNRSAFRAAELVNVSVFGGLEVQVAGQNKGFNVYRVGGETSITWPRFISPIKIADSSAFIPRTRALVSYEYQKRQKLYALNSFKGSFGYLWKDNPRVEHQLMVTDINYVSPANVTPLYQAMAKDNQALQKVIDKQLIFGPTYSYTYTNTAQKRKEHTFYYKGSFDLAGTIAGLVTGANVKKDKEAHVLGVAFSQFIKMEHDFRHYLKLNEKSQLATRFVAGVGMPYGNSTELPFIRQFFIGGANSIRAFRARSIGPGTFRPKVDASDFLPDQSGDIKLEMSTEYRAKLFSIVHGALFVDAGNIWLWNDDPDKPGGKFSKDFLSEMAVGTGAGLRFDLSVIVLRFDLAFPLRKPYLPESERWVIKDIDFGSKYWRRENLVFNIAIGYPF